LQKGVALPLHCFHLSQRGGMIGPSLLVGQARSPELLYKPGLVGAYLTWFIRSNGFQVGRVDGM